MTSRFVVPFTGRTLSRAPSFLDLHREMNRLFDDAFRQPEGSGGQRGDGGGAGHISPRVDVHETGDGLELTAELAGVDRNDIDIRVDDDVITVRGEKRNERRDAKAHVVERSFGSFERSIQLPFSPDAEKVQAHFDNGVLTIAVPRVQQQDKSRRIQIGGGQAPETQPKDSQSASPSSGESPAFFGKESGATAEQAGTANDQTASRQGEQADQAGEERK
jgi:HSP20 family protein